MSKRRGCELAVALALLFFIPMVFGQDLPEAKAPQHGAPERTPEKAVERPPITMPRTHCEPTTCQSKVLFLSNISQPTELQDILNMLRTVVEISRITQIPSEQAIILQGTPEQFALAERLVHEVDTGRRRFGTGYRLDFRVSDLEGEKEVHSRLYSLLVDSHNSSKLAIGAEPPRAGAGEVKTESKACQSTEDGINVALGAENDKTVTVRIGATLFGYDPVRADHSETPIRIETTAVLPLGKATALGALEDHNSARRLRISVTATRLEEPR